jgi:hypothetical protein
VEARRIIRRLCRTASDYPDSFKPQPAPDSDDGRAFKSADGADFTVSAGYNALDFDVAKYRNFIVKNLDPGAKVTYEAHGDNWVRHFRHQGRRYPL